MLENWGWGGFLIISFLNIIDIIKPPISFSYVVKEILRDPYTPPTQG